MANITVHGWKEVDNDGGGFTFVKPQYHITYWEIPKWWYFGKSTVYTSCARVDYNGWQMYIDGTTPLMNLKVSWDGTDLGLTEERDIRRILICNDLGAVNRQETDEYIDIENTLTEGWIVRRNGIPEPIIDIPVEWIEDPVWMNVSVDGPSLEIGDEALAKTGSYTGGMPKSDGTPPTNRARYQVRNTGTGVVTSEDWRVGVEQEQLTSLDTPADWWPEDANEIRFQNQVRDYVPGTDANRANNRFLNWRPLVVVPPLEIGPDGGANWKGSNVYVVGETVEALTSDWTGGKEPVIYHARIQEKDPITNSWSNEAWTTTGSGKESFFYKIPYSGTFRFQSQAIDANGVVVNSITGERTVPDPTTQWGAIIITVNDFEYNYFVGSYLTVLVDDPIDLKVEWEGDATGNVLWEVRNPDSVDVTFSNPNAAETSITIHSADVVSVTCTLTDPQGYADPQRRSEIVNFYAVAAFESGTQDIS